MATTLTLIAKPGALGLELIAQARAALGAIDIVTRSEVDWLSEAESCDITLPERASRAALPVVEQALAPAPVDVTPQETAAGR